MTSVEAGGMGPGQQAPARVGLAAVGAGGGGVQLEPAVELRQPRPPRERRVVGVARGDHSPGPRHPGHLAQRRDRVGDVLQHLVGVHHVELAVVERQCVNVTDAYVDAGRPCPRDRRRLLVHLERDDLGHELARSAVIVPGPEPTSSSRWPGARCGSRYAAELAAVRLRWDRSTDSEWPWV